MWWDRCRYVRSKPRNLPAYLETYLHKPFCPNAFVRSFESAYSSFGKDGYWLVRVWHGTAAVGMYDQRTWGVELFFCFVGWIVNS